MSQQSPYEAVLGADFAALHANVRRAHDAPLSADGVFEVAHGTHAFTPMLVRLLGLPRAGRTVPVTLRASLEPHGRSAHSATMKWERRFGGWPLVSHQHARGGLLVERYGPGRVEHELRVEQGGLRYEQRSARLFFLRAPASLAPRIRAFVSPESDGWRVEVVVEWRGQLICRYGGVMRPRNESP